LSEAHAGRIVERRGEGYRSVEALWRRAGVRVAALEQLADADAFRDIGLNRRQALWAIRGLDESELPLAAAAGAPPPREPKVALRRLPDGGEVVADYQSVGLTLRSHPVAFLREELKQQGIRPCAAVWNTPPGRHVTIAGLVLVRQRPGSAKGVIFITLEDETGQANIVVWSNVFERYRRVILAADMIACRGKLQREGDVIHVVAEQLTDHSALLASVGQRNIAFPLPHGRGDQASHGDGPDSRERIKVRSRDFR
jgi:error-prone DNA polymerase